MVEEAQNLVLDYLRRIDAKLDALSQAIGNLEEGVVSIEIAVAGVRRDIAVLAAFGGRSI